MSSFTKLTRSLKFRVLMLTAIGTLVFATATAMIFSYYFIAQMKDGIQTKAVALTSLLASNLAPTVDFEDDIAATEILAGLKGDEDFTYATVYKKKGNSLGTFVAVNKPPRGTEKGRGKKTLESFESTNHVHVAAPILIQNTPAGVIQVGFSLKQIDEKTRKVWLLGIGASIFLTLVFTTFFVQSMGRIVVKPIRKMTDMVTRIGDGDLSLHSESNLGTNTTEMTDINNALQKTAAAFRQSVEAISQNATDLSVTSSEILANSSSLSRAASEQASSVSETSVTLEEVEKNGHMTASRARDIEQIAGRTQEISREGLDAVEETRKRLDDVRKQAEEIFESVLKLNKQLGRVDEIINSVTAVTSQSHILSINASIEAAKAGVAGLGFSVVAREIRDLSRQSRESTEEVSSTLASIQMAIKSVLHLSEDGRESAKLGVVSIAQTGEVITRLGEVIDKTASAAREIAGNAAQQAAGLEQTSAAMSEINHVTQRNLTGITDMEGAGEQLNEKSTQMKNLVNKFTL